MRFYDTVRHVDAVPVSTARDALSFSTLGFTMSGPYTADHFTQFTFESQQRVSAALFMCAATKHKMHIF